MYLKILIKTIKTPGKMIRYLYFCLTENEPYKSYKTLNLKISIIHLNKLIFIKFVSKEISFRVNFTYILGYSITFIIFSLFYKIDFSIVKHRDKD